MRDIWVFRSQFVCEAIENLRKNLEEQNSHLSIIRGESIETIISFAKKYKLKKIYTQEAVGFYEIQELKLLKVWLENEGLSLYQIWDHTLVYKDDLDFHISDIPQVFTQFRKSVEKNSQILEPLEIPKFINNSKTEDTKILNIEDDFWYEAPKIDSRGVLWFIGSEEEAWKRLNHYFWDTESLSDYKNSRNWLIWADYSSKFSPWLAHGCISARSIYHEVKKYEKKIKKNSSTYWLVFELLWRDFFQFIFLENPTKFFKDYTEDSKIFSDKSQERKFEKWKNWTLWIPFVDANMKELAATGFMSNRGRQNVASYLVHDLRLDWRLWAKYFESQLIDYDVASNWGNWAYVAGVGNDPRDNRYFNIEKQARVYDEKWDYRKLWNT